MEWPRLTAGYERAAMAAADERSSGRQQRGGTDGFSIGMDGMEFNGFFSWAGSDVKLKMISSSKERLCGGLGGMTAV